MEKAQDYYRIYNLGLYRYEIILESVLECLKWLKQKYPLA